MVVAIFATAPAAATKLLPRVGPRPLVPSGMAIAALGLVYLTGIGLDSSYASAVLPAMIVMGVGFGLIMVGLIVAAHPSTPLGRGRGVVITMLSCFIIGLLWICTYYVFTGQHLDKIPVFNDLGQYNLLVGIGFMAVGFSYATRWELPPPRGSAPGPTCRPGPIHSWG